MGGNPYGDIRVARDEPVRVVEYRPGRMFTGGPIVLVRVEARGISIHCEQVAAITRLRAAATPGDGVIPRAVVRRWSGRR